VETQQYQRKPIIVDAVRVTEDNFFDVAHWCQGAIVSGGGQAKSIDEIKQDKNKFIKVRVINPQRVRQTKAYVGDWVLYSEYNGYKVYTNGAFENAFLGPVEMSSNGVHPEQQEMVPDGTYGGSRLVTPESIEQ
jgi:hypothetical protein